MSEPRAPRDVQVRTKENLLKAAESLFAEQGIGGASLRAITRKAGANLAAVHYHFGSKEHLVAAVLSRRLDPLNRERMELLEACERAAGSEPPDPECIVRAFVYPVLRMVQRQRGGHDFARLVGRAFSEPGDEIRKLVLERFREAIDRFTRALARALPHLPKDEIYWRFHFMVGAMVHTAGLGFLAHDYSGGVCNPLDIEGVTRRLVAFLGAGMRRAAAEEPEVLE
ncbi:MAG: TetR/AcrR family transcriptional regulator [Acidobacteriota bacterium]